jgi:hypothetical protein
MSRLRSGESSGDAGQRVCLFLGLPRLPDRRAAESGRLLRVLLLRVPALPAQRQ